jgi:glutamyl-tRNA synthetase
MVHGVMPIGRLAPSPTGAQHIGNARTFLLAWLSIRAQQGRMLLRIEDIDSPRVKAGAAEQAIADLRWLGLDWDEGPDCPGVAAPYVQSHRRALYAAALEQLIAAEWVYPCTCSRSDVAEAASAPHAIVGHEGPIYPGTCATRHAAEAHELKQPYAWRFRASRVDRVIDDRFMGRRQMNVARELGDFVVAKSDGSPAYQLAVVVDDHHMGVTEVLRGDDLLTSAFRQLELYEFFGWSPPQFAHVPLVVGPDGRRLAKRHGDTRLATLREQGVSPERLVGFLAWSCGLGDAPTACRPAELVAEFTLQQMSHEPVVLDDTMFKSLSP